MKLVVFLSYVLATFLSNGQFHDDNIPRITDLQAAKEYADRYREVSFGIVNAESDVFLFDNVDTANLKASVGQINTVYKRRTKFLMDTIVTIVNIQVIDFNLQEISKDSVEVLTVEIIGKFKKGASYWSLMKQYRSTSCVFNGGPYTTEILKRRFGNTFSNSKKNDIFKWNYTREPKKPCIIIIQQEAHSVPAFYAISYNLAG